jgi:hypothetical protein
MFSNSNGAPVVVQGTPVANPHYAQPSAPYATSPTAYATAVTNPSEKGETQETKCNDPIFAILFYICVIAIVAVAVTYGPDAVSAPTGNFNYTGVVKATIIVVVISFFGAGLGMAFMMAFPETLIKASLIFVTVMAGVWMAMAFAVGQYLMGALGLIMFAMSICYAFMVWARIPFATANLVTASTAIRRNLGVTFFAYLLTAVAGVWSVTWSVAFVGVFNKTYTCDENNVCSNTNYGYMFMLFVAYFFIHQVLQASFLGLTFVPYFRHFLTSVILFVFDPMSTWMRRIRFT